MGYRIQYPPGRRLHGVHNKISRRAVFTGIFFLLFLLCVIHFGPKGILDLRSWLFSGDGTEVLEAFAEDLGHGIPIRDAVSRFGQTILESSGHGIY